MLLEGPAPNQNPLFNNQTSHQDLNPFYQNENHSTNSTFLIGSGASTPKRFSFQCSPNFGGAGLVDQNIPPTKPSPKFHLCQQM